MTDADRFIVLLERSRREETPRRRTGQGKCLRARVVGIMPRTVAAGASRDEVVKRLSYWEPGWDRARVDAMWPELVRRGVVVQGTKGFYAPVRAQEVA